MKPIELYEKERKSLYQKLAQLEYEMGELCRKEGPEQDTKRAVELYKSAADKGHADAQNIIGASYATGSGNVKDHERAFHYYMLAASQGLAIAQLNVGFCYYMGQGVKQDYKLAVEYYSLAAKQGNIFSYHNLGTCYANGVGVAVDVPKAVEYFEKVVNQGSFVSNGPLGQCYYKGYGVEKDTKFALEIYYLGAIQGNTECQNLLTEHYRDVPSQDMIGFNSTRADILKNFNDPKSAEFIFGIYSKSNRLTSGLTSGLTSKAMLAFMYQFGIGTKRDLKQAAELYRQALQKGKPNAAILYWDLFLCNRELFTSGKLSKKELSEFYADLKRLSDESSEIAQLVGYLYERNIPELDQNLYTAFDYYRKAINLNSKDEYSKNKAKKYQELLDSNEKLSKIFELEIFEKDEPHLPNGVVRIISEYALKR